MNWLKNMMKCILRLNAGFIYCWTVYRTCAKHLYYNKLVITRKRKIEELAPKIVWLYVADRSFLPGSDSAPENALSLAGMGRLYVSGPEDPC